MDIKSVIKSIAEQERGVYKKDYFENVKRDQEPDIGFSAVKFALATIITERTAEWAISKVKSWFRKRSSKGGDDGIKEEDKWDDRIKKALETTVEAQRDAVLKPLEETIKESNNLLISALSSLVETPLVEVIEKLDDIYDAIVSGGKTTPIRRSVARRARPSPRVPRNQPIIAFGEILSESIRSSSETIKESVDKSTKIIDKAAKAVSGGKTATEKDIEEYRKRKAINESIENFNREILEKRREILRRNANKFTIGGVLSGLASRMSAAAGGGEGGMLSDVLGTIGGTFAGSALWSGVKGAGRLIGKGSKALFKGGKATFRGGKAALAAGKTGFKVAGKVGAKALSKIPILGFPLLIGGGLLLAKGQPEDNIDFLSTSIMPDTWWGGMIEGGLISGLTAAGIAAGAAIIGATAPVSIPAAIAGGALTGLAASFLGSDWFKSWFKDPKKETKKAIKTTTDIANKEVSKMMNKVKAVKRDLVVENLKNYVENRKPNSQVTAMNSIVESQKTIERKLQVAVEEINRRVGVVANPTTNVQQSVTNVNNAISMRTRPFVDDPSIITRQQLARGIK